MDAHTLNAWTRFALQKGGIGMCTALIDNPATEPEDLMFMTGEKIIVLRRLDEEVSETSSNRKSSLVGGPQDSDAWFLGYCEGVVGRFKGAHVQFHGRLKKPVLMRRSGLRDSSLRPVSKSDMSHLSIGLASPSASPSKLISPTMAALALPDDDDRASNARYSYAATNGSVETKINSHADPIQEYQQAKQRARSRSTQGGDRQNDPLGVTTPPLSDEGHSRQISSLRAALDNDSDDSDDSTSMLPWARHSRGSSAAASPVQQQMKKTILNGTAVRGAVAPSYQLRRQILQTQNLPPSPISSNESPVTRDLIDNMASNTDDMAGRNPSADDTSRTSCTSSTYTGSTTEDSDDEGGNHRRDYAFSIYDVYGRDSVAFPNFDFRDYPNRKTLSRIAASKSSESLAAQASQQPLPSSNKLVADRSLPRGMPSGSASSPSDPHTPRDASRFLRPTAEHSIPVSLKAPSGKRPNAAPDPRLNGSGGSSYNRAPQNIASSLRRKVEAQVPPPARSDSFDQISAPHGGLSPLSINTQPNGAAQRTGPGLSPGTPDYQRRPSLGNRNPLSPTGGGVSPVHTTSTTHSLNPSLSSPVDPLNEQPSLAAQMKRPGFGEARESRGSRSNPNIQLDLNSTSSARQPVTSPDSLVGLPSPLKAKGGPSGSPNLGPTRASSDRQSDRERQPGGGSGMLRKNPSNPTPGLHGGGGGFLGALSPIHRNVSPISGAEAEFQRSASDARSVSSGGRSPMMKSPFSQGPPTPMGPYQLPVFDYLGFVHRSGPLPVALSEDDEAREKWLTLMREDDLVSVKKNRKVKRLVRQGIPASIRGQTWLYLANASVRRRVGLFEQLCKVSQGAREKKGKEALYETIDKDLDRCFPDHQLFIGPEATGTADLEAILKSYVHFNPIIGYTQGMNLLAGFALINTPAEDAFWLLVAMLRDPHVEGYYTPTMKQLHVDSAVLGNLLASMDPELAQRLEEYGIQPIMFTPSWILPLFTRILPWNSLLRVWDVFFFEGPTWILRVAMSVIRIVRDQLMDRRACPGHGELLQILLHPPQKNLTPDNVLSCAFSVKFKDGEMRKLSRNASKLFREKNILNQPADARGRPSIRRASSEKH